MRADDPPTTASRGQPKMVSAPAFHSVTAPSGSVTMTAKSMALSMTF
jgi:hypothetical protein